MGLPTGFKDFYDAEARLIMLKALAEQVDYTLPENLLVQTLQAFGINKGRDYVRNQLNWLRDTAGAVTTKTAGSAIIATVTATGQDHVHGRVALEGVKRPSPPAG